jgi:hypothetical protein
MEDAILAALRGMPDASFINIENRVPGFKGDFSWDITLPSGEKKFVWEGMSKNNAINALSKLIKEDKVIATAVDETAYELDGAGYFGDPNWRPTTFTLAPNVV